MIEFFERWAAAARGFLHDLLGWVEGFAATPYGTWALFGLAFAESSFFPIPPDVLLIALCLGEPEKSLWFALVCSVGSVLGGAAGYGIGLWGGRPLLLRLFTRERVAVVTGYFDRYNAWAVGIAGLTPIPYKIFTIAGGAFAIDFRIFVLASIVSRSLRFFAIAALMWWFGEPIRAFIEEYLGWLTIGFVVLLIGGFWLAGRGAKRVGVGGGAEPEVSPFTTQEEGAMAQADRPRRFYRLEGRVQGVGFRAFIRREAQRLALAGWTRNAADGSVEVEATGDPRQLETFEERLRQGPPGARVDQLASHDLPAGSDAGSFEIRF
ncbi:MAG TPA: acylphosphatase [Thermoanaerobaculia bacterium]|nr:acylphosphatase [Thermoanaerobaculia bacterium]